MKMISLSWNDREGEGKIRVLSAFKDAHSIDQIDALTDWIYELVQLKDQLLTTQRSDVRAILWGE